MIWSKGSRIAIQSVDQVQIFLCVQFVILWMARVYVKIPYIHDKRVHRLPVINAGNGQFFTLERTNSAYCSTWPNLALSLFTLSEGSLSK